MSRVLMGPAVCQGCRQLVWLVAGLGWADGSQGRRHRCPKRLDG